MFHNIPKKLVSTFRYTNNAVINLSWKTASLIKTAACIANAMTGVVDCNMVSYITYVWHGARASGAAMLLSLQPARVPVPSSMTEGLKHFQVILHWYDIFKTSFVLFNCKVILEMKTFLGALTNVWMNNRHEKSWNLRHLHRTLPMSYFYSLKFSFLSAVVMIA